MTQKNVEFSLPVTVEDQAKRKTARHLPSFFRTDSNKKFLGGTLDSLTQPGKLDRINAYVGRRDITNYKFDDTYLQENSTQRQYYQLEPAFVYENNINGELDWHCDYIDYINALRYFGADTKNHSRLNKQEAYAWDPCINWDKLVNYREYYWLPNGTDPVVIFGEIESTVSTFTVTVADQGDNFAYIFSPDGLTANPKITLYRGVKYRFEINTPGYPIAFKTSMSPGDSFFYEKGVSVKATENGVIEFEVPYEAPDVLYYLDNNGSEARGTINIKDISESAFLNVENSIIGKKTFSSSTGVNFVNGLKIKFEGKVQPEKYAEGFWIVEGVGDAIRLVKESEIEAPAIFDSTTAQPFDAQPFDSAPWDDATNASNLKDYIVINRSSKDRNAWTRNNKWVHRNAIEESAKANGSIAILDQSARATRPIIEFDPDVKLFNHGYISKLDVDLVDDATKDVFSTIEGSNGYIIDGEQIYPGYRILFLADTDKLVYGRVFEVKEVRNIATGKNQLTLQEVLDTEPLDGENVYVRKGKKYQGASFNYNNGVWNRSQHKLNVNQAPLFDLFDSNMVSYSDQTVYPFNTFKGTRIFGYKVADGVNDPILGFPISYRNITNVGDIEFSFDLQNDKWSYTKNSEVITEQSFKGFLRKLTRENEFLYTNGWVRIDRNLEQNVVRILEITGETDLVAVDVYNNSSKLTDLKLRVYVNDVKRNDLSLVVIEDQAFIKFDKSLKAGDKVVYKARSNANKNDKGFYEIPLNWQNNPLNQPVDSFTFGEVIDHVKTVVENNGQFSGDFPGISNLDLLGDLSAFGRKFLQHGGSTSLAAYVLTDKDANLIKSLRWAARKYSEFKKEFIRLSETLGFDGSPREIVDQILLKNAESKYVNLSAFYYSDMAPFGGASVREYRVEDPRLPIFVIDSIFDPVQKTKRNILIYCNEVQLLYGIDYTFNQTDAFVEIKKELNVGDIIVIKDYETTDGCYVPYTPTKLGLYPLFEPKVFVDNTYREPTKVIQGHDGSIMRAYDDYRDDVILELERRMFNSCREKYNPKIFNVHDIIGGYYRKTDFTRSEVNDVLLSEFLRWNSIPKFDFNTNDYFVEGETFTYNYSNSLAPNLVESLPGNWRSVYRYFFDTDRPHMCPWEMQGFTMKPEWWDSVYGEAPYTSDNKILWEAIEKGIISDPNNPRIELRYARPGIQNYIPVDNQGNLISPLDSNLAQEFSLINATGRYAFGDESPVEAAWRKSSEYPFAIMIALATLRASDFILKSWDRFSIKRNIADQIYSTVTGKFASVNELVFPSKETVTSGLVNILDEYITVERALSNEKYKLEIAGLDAKLSYRVGGFTSKDKLRVLLDSRSPNASGTVFLPEENYKIAYNKSFSVKTSSYSGVIVEKVNNGFAIRGYDNEKNYFEFLPPIPLKSDVRFNVGGISEPFVDWTADQFYTRGQIIKINNSEYYRAKVSHNSSANFTDDDDKWQKIGSLPIIGGQDALKRTRFESRAVKVPYGTVFEDIQSIVDFLYGYQEQLKILGFEFNEYSKVLNVPLNWDTSIKEFMFWTLQTWSRGAVITLSPAATKLKFTSPITATVDNLDVDFYDYSIFTSDGTPLKKDLTNVFREDNGFTVEPLEISDNGVFHIRVNLVYKEHIILFDNRTIFNDVIYDVVPGYRQGRVKLVGFKTSNWDGGFNVPGFMFDEAKVFDWEPNTDYTLGDVVKYQNYYYTAIKKNSNKTTFDFSDWSRLENDPVQTLVPNFDYRVEQFRDLYDLESSNFDLNQQLLARHLIGYQPRQYLENIINDDVAQFKFYQGFIKEKGTLNSIEKLFDALRSSGFSSVDIKEEWAFRIGTFGASDAYKEIEFALDEQKVLYNPQDIVLTQNKELQDDLTVYNVTASEVAIKPADYNSKPFSTKALDHNQNDYGLFKYKVAGYVREQDVDHVVFSEENLFNYDLSLLNHKQKVWLGNTSNGDWAVYNFFNTQIFIDRWSISDNLITLFCNKVPDVLPNDIIAVKNLGVVDGIYRVQRVYNNIIEIVTTSSTIFPFVDDSLKGILFKFEKVRFATIKDVAAKLYNDNNVLGEKLWIDKDSNNNWLVLENQKVFTDQETTPVLDFEGQEFGSDVIISKNEQFMIVSSPKHASGKVFVYSRPNSNSNWAFIQTIAMPTGFTDLSGTEMFGSSVAISNDGQILAISAPNASNLKSFFRGNFSTILNYNVNEIVEYEGKLWRCLQTFIGDGSSNPIESHDWEEISIYEGQQTGFGNGLTNQGVVFVYKFDPINRRFEREIVLGSFSPTVNERFGSKVKIVNDGLDYWLFVASKNFDQDTGRVQVFRKQHTIWRFNSQVYLDFTNIRGTYMSIHTPVANSMYGYDIDVSQNANYVAVSAPFLESGAVYVFERNQTEFELVQIIDSYTIENSIVTSLVDTEGYLKSNDLFGYSIAIDSNMLLVSSPNNDRFGFNTGVVHHFKINSDESSANPFELTQVIKAPVKNSNERFGTKIAVNSNKNILAVSAIGGSSVLDTTFDNYSERESETEDSTNSYVLDENSSNLSGTTFDSRATAFYDKVPYTGSVYVFNNFDDEFVFADKLRPQQDLVTNNKFGYSINVGSNTILVGTPNRNYKKIAMGAVFMFNFDTLSWTTIAQQNELVDITKLKKAFLYNTKTNKLIDYLDFIDPAKGKISNVAEQELSFQTYYDPAIYEFGDSNQVAVDQTSMWTDENVGKLWWDLSKVKFTWYEQGDSTYRNNNWGRIFPGSTIDIYEWVETPYLPSRWAELANTEEGIALGISGTPKDIDNFTYSTKVKYDEVTKVRTTMYYYWVKNKTIVPRNFTRRISAADVARLILDPKSQGIRFVAVTSNNSLTVANVNTQLIEKDIALNLQYFVVDNAELLTHREYALVTKDDKDSRIPRVLENKWFDSLIGANSKGDRVPDLKLNVRQRYGTLNSPRQSWFVNRLEALKQLIEYLNSVLISKQVVNNTSLSKLNTFDPAPDIKTGLIDQIIDIDDELRFIGTANIKPAKLTVTVLNGKIENVFVQDSGYGYKVAPLVTIKGTGTGAEIVTTIDSQGRVSTATIVKAGENYDVTTQVTVRNYSVLILNDSDANNGWSIQEWDSTKRRWQRIKTQSFDTRRYWNFADWYAPGYGADTSISYTIDNISEIYALDAKVGQTVKILNSGNNKWLLLQRKATTNDIDYTVDYSVIGSQDATIQFSDALYNFDQNFGFDSKFSFDSNLYDRSPTTELRHILEAIRDDILINDLRSEYINIFFNSVHYVFNEQKFVDWAFKTSFLKVRHTVGTLRQRTTFQGDPLESYEQYIEETKPFKSKIREFVSSYDVIDTSMQQTTDFDLPPVFDEANRVIKRVTKDDVEISRYPWKSWLDNHTYSIKEIVIKDQGDGYTTVPKVIISGGGGTGAKATAYISRGKLYKIIVDNSGQGYLSTPQVFISGGNGDNEEKRATAYAVISNEKVRTNLIGMKYDRIVATYESDSFKYTDTFTGTGSQTRFKLTYAPEIQKDKISILINENEIYGAQYDVEVIKTTQGSFDDYEGYIIFKEAPLLNDGITVTYDKNIKLYSATDRINYSYNPTTGQYGKDLGQLMIGVDYGGVQITGLDFNIDAGWDTLPWDVISWDSVPSTNDDVTVVSDGVTRQYTLPYIPENNEIITVYLNGTRIDDPYFDLYDGSTTQPNGRVEPLETALMNSFVGDGASNIITIPVVVNLNLNDVIVFRKATSDGTVLPTDQSAIDTLLSGGDLSYNTATGFNAEDIIVDGDGFNTEDTAHGPEELVQGQVVDTVSINVYSAPASGGPNVYVQNFIGDGATDTFSLTAYPSTTDSLMVLVNDTISEYTIDYANKAVVLPQAPLSKQKVVIITIDTAGFDITEQLVYFGDGSTKKFTTSTRYNNGDVSGFITVNGVSVEFELSQDELNNVLIDLNEVPDENAVIQIMLFRGTTKKWSEVKTQIIQVNPQNFVYNLDPLPQNIGPLSSYVFVMVDNEFLQAPDYAHAKYNQVDIFLDDIRYTANMLSPSDVIVFRNGTMLTPVSDYQFDSSQNKVSINNEIAAVGDDITIEILVNADYQIKDNKLYFMRRNYSLLGKQTIKVTTFTNHDILKVKTVNETFRFSNGYDVVPYDITIYDTSSPAINTSGIFDLPRKVSAKSGVFVALSNKLLSPNVDYVVLDNLMQVRVDLPDNLDSVDYIQIITFNEDTVKGSTGFKIFKDMLNRTHYKRLSERVEVVLTKELNYFDTAIEVNNASMLPVPNKGSNLPGVIEIDSERIEYFEVNGNTLSQLRRATLGTGTKQNYSVGTKVTDVSSRQTLPYVDKEVKKTFIGDGSTQIFEVGRDLLVNTSTLATTWYRDTIPSDFGQCDIVEVFVSGRRLRKSPTRVYDQALGQNSYNNAGDKWIEAEFSVNGTNNQIRLTNAPSAGEVIVVVYKQGQTWQPIGDAKSLVNSNTKVAKFLTNEPTFLPK